MQYENTKTYNQADPPSFLHIFGNSFVYRYVVDAQSELNACQCLKKKICKYKHFGKETCSIPNKDLHTNCEEIQMHSGEPTSHEIPHPSGLNPCPT
jgi:hypothetical protein